MTEQALRTAIVAACRQMNECGLNQGMAGNISARIGENMLITPTATPYDTMSPEDIATFPLAGAARDATGPLRPSSEWRFHRDLLRARDDVGAVVHAHPPFATALAVARRSIPPCHYMIATFGGEDVRCADYATFGTAALSDAVTRAMQNRHGCLMANHGMLATGRDLAQAMWRAIELEALARQYLLAQAAGGAVLLSPQDIAEAYKMFATYRPG